MAGQAVINEVTDLRNDLNNQIVSRWNTQWISPYIRCYDTALSNYQRAIARQVASDKARMELVLTAMTIVGGSIAGAVFGKTAAKEIAADVTVDLICKNNMNRAFRLAAWAESSVAAKFALGQVWDTASAQLSNELKARLTSNIGSQYTSVTSFANNPGLSPGTGNTTATQTTFLHDFVHDNLISVDQAAQDIRDNGDLSDDQRLARLRELRQSPFFRVPPAPNETNYARDMELAMWMKWLLGTDRLVVSEASSSSGVTASARTLSNNPVNTSPSARSYPTSRNLQSRITRGGLFGLSRGTYVKRQDVQYGRIGGDINDRIDTVHRARFGREFFHDSWAGNEANDRDVLRRAERRLRGLANRSTWQR